MGSRVEQFQARVIWVAWDLIPFLACYVGGIASGYVG